MSASRPLGRTRVFGGTSAGAGPAVATRRRRSPRSIGARDALKTRPATRAALVLQSQPADNHAVFQRSILLALAAGLLAAGCTRGVPAETAAAVAPDTALAAPADTLPEEPPAVLVTMEVGGMICESCVIRVEQQITAVPGVRHVRVDLDSQRAEIALDHAVPDTALTAAVRRAGPDLLGIIVSR